MSRPLVYVALITLLGGGLIYLEQQEPSVARIARRSTVEPTVSQASHIEQLAQPKLSLFEMPDAPTGQGFKVGPGGKLVEAPTERIRALDNISENDTQEGAKVAREVLERSNSADEWAVAMRNYARGTDNAASDPYLKAKVAEFATKQEWIENPTVGFLQGFDLIVFTHAIELIPHLRQLSLSASNRALKHAATLALDQLAVVDTEGSMAQLLSLPAENVNEQTQRATLMARADVRQSGQRQMLEQYLESATDHELGVFSQFFPMYSRFGGHFLVTEFKPLPLKEMAARDRATLEVVRSWKVNPRLVEKERDLARIEERLTEYVESAKRGGV